MYTYLHTHTPAHNDKYSGIHNAVCRQYKRYLTNPLLTRTVKVAPTRQRMMFYFCQNCTLLRQYNCLNAVGAGYILCPGHSLRVSQSGLLMWLVTSYETAKTLHMTSDINCCSPLLQALCKFRHPLCILKH